MPLHHYLRPLLMPESVALVGASERAGSLGRVVFENLLDASYTGEIHAVNPNHRRVLGRRSLVSIESIGKPVDLVLVAIRCAQVPGVLEQAARAGDGGAISPRSPTDAAYASSGRMLSASCGRPSGSTRPWACRTRAPAVSR